MSVSAVRAYNAFVSVLALAALAMAVALLFVPSVRVRVRNTFSSTELLSGAAVVAAVATAGSLTYSEVVGFVPCFLCWVQRGFMYPLVIIAAWAGRASRRSERVWLAPFVVAAGGFMVSVWHYLEQTIPGLSIGACEVGVPCGAKYVNQFGFVSIPFMAGCGFLLIMGLALTARRSTGQPARRSTAEITS